MLRECSVTWGRSSENSSRCPLTICTHSYSYISIKKFIRLGKKKEKKVTGTGELLQTGEEDADVNWKWSLQDVVISRFSLSFEMVCGSQPSCISTSETLKSLWKMDRMTRKCRIPFCSLADTFTYVVTCNQAWTSCTELVYLGILASFSWCYVFLWGGGLKRGTKKLIVCG